MDTLEEQRQDWQVIQAMKWYGGCFVEALSNLWLLADSDNQRRIKEAWPEYWKQYAEMAEELSKVNGKDWWDR